MVIIIAIIMIILSFSFFLLYFYQYIYFYSVRTAFSAVSRLLFKYLPSFMQASSARVVLVFRSSVMSSR
jgi:hypothetical protein